MISPAPPPNPCSPYSTKRHQMSTFVASSQPDNVPFKRPWTDLISPYRPPVTAAHQPRLALQPRLPPPGSRPPLVDSNRFSPSIPRKRSMQAPSEQTSCGHPLPVPSSPTLSRCSDPIATPARDAFFPSPGRASQPDNDNSQSKFLGGFHRYRNSASTSASVSTNSSPTTSTSVVDSCAADTPGTSPDTPASTQSYNYPSLSMAIRTSQEQKSELRPVPAPFSKKPRNLKNLAVNTSSTFPLVRAVSTAALPMDPPKSPSTSSSLSLSPTFVLPSKLPPRRPNGAGLTIQTPASGTFPLQQVHPPVLSPPSLVRPAALRSFQSTPSLPLFSAGLPPEGGMRLPNFSPKLSSAPSEVEEDQALANAPAPAYELPESQEAKPDAYPHGPICIYDPHVYLYFEPTAEEASTYDVIFNVASEVKNPFSFDAQSRVKSVDLQAAVKALAETSSPSSPSTPRPTGATSTDSSEKEDVKRPEYIHVPWEHNTDIVPGSSNIPSLYDIIRIIDSRVQQGKRVLIHCQCGVSRSASLIVAYGLYKNPSITVQEAYNAVKQKSEWIGPNMNLIMQLQEFRNILLLGAERSTQPPQNLQKPVSRLHGRVVPNSSSSSSSSSNNNNNNNNNNEEVKENVPQTAPLPQQLPKLAPPPLITQNLHTVSPGPSSAPSDFHWQSVSGTDTATPTSTNTTILPETSLVDAAGQVVINTPATVGRNFSDTTNKPKKAALAIRTDIEPKSLEALHKQVHIPTGQVESPRATEFSMAPIRPKQVEDMFGITSPRTTDLPPSSLPFGTTTASQSEIALEPLSSPRSLEFAMTSVQQPPVDETFGLTSPRTTSTFTTLLPHRPQPDNYPRVTALQPPVGVDVANAQARAELRSQLGFNSTRSQTDMHAAYVGVEQSQDAVGVPLAVAPQKTADTREIEPIEALMSPRAAEFITDPFHDALIGGIPDKSITEDVGGGQKSLVSDPRSPPLKGGNPIVRNIFDVLQ